MQAYGLSNVHREPYTLDEGWERGEGGVTARVVSPGDEAKLSLAAVAWTPGTSGTIHGQVIVWNPTSAAAVDAYRGKLKDAIILFQPPSDPPPLMAAPDETSVDAVFNHGGGSPRHPSVRKPTTEPAVEPSPQERFAIFAKSLALFKSEKIGGFLMDSGRPMGLLMMYGFYGNEAGPFSHLPFPVLLASNESYGLLTRLSDEAAGKPVEVDLNDPAHLTRGPITVENVVGELPGSEKPDEAVVLGAHLDSWDLAQGTTDNGTGTCVVLETARALVKSGVHPRRTIRFVLFTGEEEGDLGSSAYVKAHKTELPKISMCLVDDAGTGRTVGLHTQRWSAIGAILTAEAAPTLAAMGFTRIVPGSPIPGGGGGSDHDEFEAAGVPGFMFDQLDDDYHLVFHSQVDTLDKADPEALRQTSGVMAVLGLHVANLPGLLPRDK
jgi:hypothetical protein